MQKYTFAAMAVLLGWAAVPAVAADHPMPGLIQVAGQDHDHDHAAQNLQGTKGKGVVNSVDVAAHKVNVSHEPLPSLSWPAMKMDFAVAPSVDLKSVKAGTQVEFTVGKNKEGQPEIQAIQPVKK
ncbi:MAG: copper-binding protein [Rhodospirillaceae bacterium]|nr:copper-binding protein [Rhodospirillaceae bacterium]